MEFDEHLTSPTRLAIIASLVPGRPLTFTELKRATGLSDGNLSVQTRKLQQADYIEIRKEQRGKRSVTHFRIAEAGIASLKFHIRKLQAIVASESGVVRPVDSAGRRDESQVWSQ